VAWACMKVKSKIKLSLETFGRGACMKVKSKIKLSLETFGRG